MNKALLGQLRNDIARTPHDFDMRNWECGTTHCLGGMAVARAGLHILPRVGLQSARVFETGEEVQDAAKRLLGLTHEQAVRLFYYDEWPPQFAKNYWDARYNVCERAQIALDRIDFFIRTDGTDRWHG